MGGALLDAVAPNWPGEIFVVDPSAEPRFGQGVCDLAELPQVAGALVLVAVKPQVIGSLWSGLRPLAHAKALFLSVVAGVSTARFRSELGQDFGLVRAMPNTPAAIGAGVTGAFAAPGLSPSERAAADGLLRSVGAVVWLESEHAIDLVTAISGSGPAYFFRLAESMAQAGVSLGLSPETAALLARKTLEGSGALAAAAPDRDVAKLRSEVTSPGGTTAAALAAFDAEDRLQALVLEAVTAAARRAEQLGTLA